MPPTPSTFPRQRFVIYVALGLLAAAWCVLRLLWLEHSPPGLSMDEALAGVHVQCLAETGRSADGVRWPLFATGLGGGLYTPIYLTTLFGWTKVFGNSIGSIRAMGSAYCLVAIFGLGMLARKIAGDRTAALVLLAAALSPWSFQLSRLGADAPIVPAFLVWGTYFFLRSTTATSAALSGVFFALAAYSYPPTRVHAPLVVVLVLVIERKRLSPRRLVAFCGSGFVLCLPLFKLLIDGTLMKRSAELSIFSRDYVNDHRGPLSSGTFVIKQALDNLVEHARPSYLFFTGDPNLRHSTQRIGELGWLDTFAVFVAAAAIGVALVRALRGRLAIEDLNSVRLWRILPAAALAAVFGTLPAALCWEGLPHAYRSIGVYPCVALFTGACLSLVWGRTRLVPVVVLALAVGQTVTFLPDYFGDYRNRSAEAFDAPLKEAAERGDKAEFERLAKPYPTLGFRFYLMRNFGYDCLSSQTEADRIASK